MPTFYDPVADAEEASQALRGLAHASRHFEHPEDAYGVIGDLLAGVRSMQQSIEQLAQRHRRHEGRALDEAGDPAAGIRDAQVTADQLASAAASLDAVEDQLNAAMQAAGRIAWHPAPTTNAVEAETVQPDAAGAESRESRWVNIVFVQGGEADTVLWLIDRDGPEAAIEYLASWDFGEETTAAAMENGYVYDTVPVGAADRQASNSDYVLTYNHDLGHVGLYRQHPIPPEDRLDTPAPEAPTAPTIPSADGAAGAATAAGGASAAAGRGSARSARASGSSAARGRKETGKVSERSAAASATDGSWFTHPGVAAVRRDRGLGL